MTTSDYKEPVVYVTLMHYTSFVSFGMTLLAGHCIIYKTPKLMSSYSKVLLNHLVWSFLGELILNSGATPVIFSPYPAGYPDGFFNLFGISSHIQTSIGFFLLVGVAATILHIYMHRYATLKRIKSSYHRYLYLIATSVVYLGYLSAVIFFAYILAPNMEENKQYAIENFAFKIPLNDTRVIIYVFGDDVWVKLAAAAIFLLIGGESMACVFLAALSFYELKAQSAKVSSQTAKMQWAYLQSLCIQTAVFALVLVGPASIVVFSIVIEYRVDAIVNMMIYFLSWNGTADTICVLLLNRAYRKAVKQVFVGIGYRLMCRPVPEEQKSTSSVDLSRRKSVVHPTQRHRGFSLR